MPSIRLPASYMLKTLSRRSPLVAATRFDVSTTSRNFAPPPVVGRRFFSAVPETDYESGPTGDLLNLRMEKAFSDDLVGKRASIRRVFGPNANAQGLLACGGEDLARHASFDPDYDRARSWIQNRAIGPAVLSPVLINGLVGALVEAVFPQSVPVEASMHQTRPLIVGQEVCASVQVVQVEHFTGEHLNGSSKEKDWGSPQEGHEIRLETEVIRTQDNEVIAQGTHSVWIPGYLSSYR